MIVRSITSHNIHLTGQHGAANDHGNRDDWEVDTGKFKPLDMDVLARQDVSPKESGQRRAERRTECAIIHPNGHAVHGSPERAVTDVCLVHSIDLLPCLNDSG